MKILFNGYEEAKSNGKKKPHGGVQVFTKQFAQFLNNNSIEFIGLILKSKRRLSNTFEAIESKDKHGKWVEITTAFNINRILNSKDNNLDKLTERGERIVAEVIRNNKPDIVLLNGFPFLNWYILKAAYRAGVPVVLSHHGLWFKEFTEYSKQTKRPFKRELYNLEKKASKLTAHEIFLNTFSLREFENEFGKLKYSRISVIPITVDNVFSSKIKKRKNKKLKIGFVGRWDAVKGPDVYLSIAEVAKQNGLGWEFYAVTAFTKNPNLSKIVKRFEKTIKVISHLDKFGLRKFYDEMDILILPSAFDVSPIVVAEAALREKATIISPKVGWVDHYKKFGMSEWIDDFSDKAATLKKIEKLSQKKLPKKFPSYLKKNHNIDKVLAEHIKLLKTVLKNSPKIK